MVLPVLRHCGRWGEVADADACRCGRACGGGWLGVATAPQHHAKHREPGKHQILNVRMVTIVLRIWSWSLAYCIDFHV